jgi:hypothetical protein
MANNIVEIIIKAIDQASGTFKDIESSGTSAGQTIASHWKEIGLAAAAAGAAIELVARQQGQLAEQTDKIAIAAKTTSEDINQMARDVAGAGDSISETLSTISVGVTQNLAGDDLKQYAEYWDMVGDAAGESGDAAAEAGLAFSQYGITAKNVAESQGALGYVLSETTLGVTEFAEMCGKVGPEVQDLGLSVDQMAIILGDMAEKGIPPKKAIALIGDAANTAKGDINVFAKELGISADQLKNAGAITATYADNVKQMAAAHESNLTPIQKMSSLVSEITYKYGGMIQGMAGLAPALIAVGPALKIFDMLKTGILAAGGAMPFLTGGLAGVAAVIVPLLPIIAGLAAAAVLLYAAWKTNFLGIRDVTASAADYIKDRFAAIKDAAGEIGDAIAPSLDKLKSALGDLFGKIDELFRRFTGGIGIMDAVSTAFSLLGRVLDAVVAAFGRIVSGGINFLLDGLSKLVSGISKVVDWLTRLAENPVVSFFIDKLGGAVRYVGQQFDTLLPPVEQVNAALESAQGAGAAAAGGLDEAGGAAQGATGSFTELGSQGSAAMGTLAANTATAVSQVVTLLNQMVDGVKMTVTQITNAAGAAMNIVYQDGMWKQVQQTGTSQWATQGGYSAGKATTTVNTGAGPISIVADRGNTNSAYTNGVSNQLLADLAAHSQNAPDWAPGATGLPSVPTGASIGYLVNDGTYRAIDTGGSGSVSYVQLTKAEWESKAAAGIQVIGAGEVDQTFSDRGVVPYSDLSQYVSPGGFGGTISTGTGGGGMPILGGVSQEDNLVAKIAEAVIAKTNGGTNITISGPVIADRAGLMMLNREIEKVKVLESARRGGRTTV